MLSDFLSTPGCVPSSLSEGEKATLRRLPGRFSAFSIGPGVGGGLIFGRRLVPSADVLCERSRGLVGRLGLGLTGNNFLCLSAMLLCIFVADFGAA